MEPSEFIKTTRGNDEYLPRRFRTKKNILEKFGYAVGCPGRRASSRGTDAMGHNEEGK